MRTRSTPGAILRLAQPELLTAVSLAWLWRMWPSVLARPRPFRTEFSWDRPWFSAVEKESWNFTALSRGNAMTLELLDPTA
jgi:hypothetical protein